MELLETCSEIWGNFAQWSNGPWPLTFVSGASLLLLVSAPTDSAGEFRTVRQSDVDQPVHLSLLLSPVSLRVSPDLQQFFGDQTVNLSCEDQLDSDGLVVKKKKTGGPSASCGADFGRLSSPFCLLNEYKNFSGSYWCETKTGDRSDLINVIVSGTEPWPPSELGLSRIIQVGWRWLGLVVGMCNKQYNR